MTLKKPGKLWFGAHIFTSTKKRAKTLSWESYTYTVDILRHTTF